MSIKLDGDADVDIARQAPSGIVKPPRDIQAIIEKTAGYVSRNGHVFEERIRDKEKNNSKFSFLNPQDAYAPFYAWRLDEIKEGRGTIVSAGRAGEIPPSEANAKPKGPAPPSDFLFSARMPNISAQDLDIVKMTALFVASNGKPFMTSLIQREGRNYQFDFLRPQHSLHQFFSRLVDQYKQLLERSISEIDKASETRMRSLAVQATDRGKMMERAKLRAEWTKFQEEQKLRKEEAAEKEQLEYAQIDWHDFVVVETVLFDEADDQVDLPAPTSSNDLQSTSLEQKAAMSLQSHDRRIEEALPTADDYNLMYSHPTSAPTYFIPPQATAAPQYGNDNHLASLSPPLAPAIPAHVQQGGDEEHAIAMRNEARTKTQAAQAAARNDLTQTLRIRDNYVPRAQAKKQNANTAICPNCKQLIPVNEMEHHMKVELLDPRWKEQRLKAESRATTTNLSTSDVAANLKRLASQRSDVFQGVLEPSQTVDETRRKRVTIDNGLVGQNDLAQHGGAFPSSIPGSDTSIGRDLTAEHAKTRTIEEQIRLIHQKAKS